MSSDLLMRTHFLGKRLCQVFVIFAGALIANTAWASDQAEVNKESASMKADLTKAGVATLAGRPLTAAFWAGWATGKATLVNIWGAKQLLSSNTPRFADTVAFAQAAVVNPPPPTVLIANADAADLFGLLSVDPSVQAALNTAMLSDAAITTAAAGFMLADSRFLGAINASDFVSAAARLSEMQSFRNQAVAAVPAAAADWGSLQTTLGNFGLDIPFLSTETQAVTADLQANGRAAFSGIFIDSLHDHGYSDAWIDLDFVPKMAANTFAEDSNLLDQFALIFGGLNDLGPVMDALISANAQVIPSPASLSLPGLVSMGLVARRRRL